MSATFLTAEEIIELTGRVHKALQIRALAKMGLPFHVNDVGRPVVARVAIEGKQASPPARKPVVPRLFRAG